MDASMLLEYGWVLLILVGLEGILAADNAVVMAVMVKHLPPEQRKKALFYGLFGAFLFRFLALFMISFLVDVWQVQAVGAIYLFYVAINHFIKKKRDEGAVDGEEINAKGSGFWTTVLKVELADIAFAVDSMLAAVALAVTLQPTGWFHIGGIDGGQFTIMFLGGIIGLVIMRFAATWFVKLLEKYPTLESTAFLIVGWVGVKLAVFTLAHPEVALLDQHFPESKVWKSVFWSILILLAAGGYLLSKKKAAKAEGKELETE
ncbi:TerC family protein [Rossellomorea aquimaris]|uniref:TerC family protein n=1 Tax=Rossellomorea aquimaris TaxID=189382 RepID=UPI001CD65925|nr:TerC family protein [Rossellomorea aquimaris]MCA1056670.1 TerC family protein [Rossellomorea aquimaris]